MSRNGRLATCKASEKSLCGLKRNGRDPSQQCWTDGVVYVDHGSLAVANEPWKMFERLWTFIIIVANAPNTSQPRPPFVEGTFVKHTVSCQVILWPLRTLVRSINVLTQNNRRPPWLVFSKILGCVEILIRHLPGFERLYRPNKRIFLASLQDVNDDYHLYMEKEQVSLCNCIFA
jgi:hypothetical protein